jgi:UDP-4-amino-4,6-dideoxy-N-acetyl-beta-L-altrosamine transaminase
MIPYAKHHINNDDIKAVIRSLKSEYLTQGPEVKLFENDLKKKVNSKFATVVNSCTSALHISCLALNLKKNDYLWTTPISFVASANCALYCGAKIDFVDISLEDYNIDIDQLTIKLEESKKKKKLPKILVVVHLAGISCDMKRIFDLSKKYNFKIIEDGCHAFAGTYRKFKIGSCRFSHITTFSFHAIKNITSGEGGAVLTNDSLIANKLDLYRNHGITKQKKFFKNKNKEILPTHYEQIALGYNYRLTDFQAALARSQLKRTKKIMKERKFIHNFYLKKLLNLPLKLPTIREYNDSGYHLFIARLDKKKTKKTRLQLVNYLLKKNILLGFHYIPIFTHPYYQKFKLNINQFPNTKIFSNTAVSLPIYNGLNKHQLEYIVRSIKNFFKND